MLFAKKNNPGTFDSLSPILPSRFANERLLGSEKYTIGELEALMANIDKAKDRILFLKCLADSYIYHFINSPEYDNAKDYIELVKRAMPTIEKALSYYYEASELGSNECLYEHGKGLSVFYRPFDNDKFVTGVIELCQSYVRGCEKARDTLQQLVDDQVFKNCNSVEDILKLCQVI